MDRNSGIGNALVASENTTQTESAAASSTEGAAELAEHTLSIERSLRLHPLLASKPTGYNQFMSTVSIRDHFYRLHKELRNQAAEFLRDGWKQSAATLQASDVVQQLYLKLEKDLDKQLPDANFFALASVAMRNILVDYVRAKNAQKRGGTGASETKADAEDPKSDVSQADRAKLRKAFDEDQDHRRTDVDLRPDLRAMNSEQLELLSNALERLHENKPDLARVLDMFFFAEMPLRDIAEVERCSLAIAHARKNAGVDVLHGYLAD